jgi:signal transduction histidine kinase
MRIWVRIFVLSTSIAAVSVVATGTLAVREGYRTQLAGEVRGLMRLADAAAALATNQLRTAQYLAGTAEGTSPVSAVDFIRQTRDPIAPAGTGIEIFTTDLTPLFSEGHAELPPAPADSPELASAAAGQASWVLRRPSSTLELFLAAPEKILEESFVIRANVRLDELDSYGRSQLLLLSAAALATVLLLSAAAFAGSRAIAGGLEVLAAQAAAMAAGDYRGRVSEHGAVEVAAVARGFNRMAENVEAAVARLRAEKEDRQAFIDDLTHELRTPITSIVGFADHLRRRSYDEALFTEGLGRIHSEGLRILSVSEGLKRLLLSRTGARELANESASALLQQAASDAAARRPDWSFSVEAAEGAASVAVDRTLILTALANLVDNATRACAPGSTVVLGCTRAADGLHLFVRDPGGVTPGSGLGLGKSICREIAEYHGARLEYTGSADGGTTASIVFPNLQ